MSNRHSSTRIAIIGGGPAGLSLARILKDDHNLDTTIFEAQDRIGGKSLTFERGDFLCEMGTCYATRSDRIARRWMKRYGLKTETLGSSVLDGQAFMSYVNKGKGRALPLQLSHYLSARRRLLNRLEDNPCDESAVLEAAQPIREWLRERNLHKIERIHQRGMTIMGYGFLEETSTLQALRWVDWDLILSGAIRDLLTPVKGWSEFWERVAQDLDVRRASAVTHIDRSASKVTVQTASNTYTYDIIVCAMPLDEFASLSAPIKQEEFVNQSIEWGGYCTSLVAADWFRREQTRGYSAPLMSSAQAGRMLAARHEGRSDDLGGELYVCGQMTGSYLPAELQEILISDIEADGGKNVNVILQKRWKYFPRYKSSALRNGLLGVMRQMQGSQSTWYTGATFSHEAVSKITRFNKALAPRIAASLGATT